MGHSVDTLVSNTSAPSPAKPCALDRLVLSSRTLLSAVYRDFAAGNAWTLGLALPVAGSGRPGIPYAAG
jgi:hypothetical protein